MSQVEKMFVVPAKGIQVRDPRTNKHIPAEGADVPRTQFWFRRIADGDVTEAVRPAKKPAGKKEQAQ